MKSHSHENLFERNPRKTLFLITILSVFVILIVADTLIAPAESDQSTSSVKRFIRLRENPPNLNSTVLPTDTYMKETDSLTQEDFRFRTDKHGFILPTEIHSSPDISLVFLGGSTTESKYVKEKKRFPYLAGRLIEKKTRLKINSYNGGVSGNNTLHSINILINKVIPMKPDYAVLMHNANDMAILMYEGTYWNNDVSRGLIVESNVQKQAGDPSWLRFLISIKDMLFPNLYNKLRSVFDVRKILGYPYQTQADEWANIKSARIERKKILSLFEQSLHTFIDVSKNWAIVPILMTQANRIKAENMPPVISDQLQTRLKNLKIELRDWVDLYESMQTVTRRVAKARGVLVIDLERLIPKDQRYMYDLAHLNSEGSELAAHIISEEISELSLKQQRLNDPREGAPRLD